MTARMTKTLRPRRRVAGASLYRGYHSYPHDLEVVAGEPDPELYLYKGAGGRTRTMEPQIITGDSARELLARLQEATAQRPPSLGGGDGVAQVLAEAWSRARGGKYDYWDPKAGRGGRGNEWGGLDPWRFQHDMDVSRGAPQGRITLTIRIDPDPHDRGWWIYKSTYRDERNLTPQQYEYHGETASMWGQQVMTKSARDLAREVSARDGIDAEVLVQGKSVGSWRSGRSRQSKKSKGRAIDVTAPRAGYRSPKWGHLGVYFLSTGPDPESPRPGERLQVVIYDPNNNVVRRLEQVKGARIQEGYVDFWGGPKCRPTINEYSLIDIDEEGRPSILATHTRAAAATGWLKQHFGRWAQAHGVEQDADLSWEDSPSASGRGARVRAVSAIAADILSDWPNVNYAAKPYLEAMFSLRGVDDDYLYDSGRGIITRFLGNAHSWRGPKARAIKAELNAMLDA